MLLTIWSLGWQQTQRRPVFTHTISACLRREQVQKFGEIKNGRMAKRD